MLSEICPDPLAASATLRDISFVVALCSSSAAAPATKASSGPSKCGELRVLEFDFGNSYTCVNDRLLQDFIHLRDRLSPARILSRTGPSTSSNSNNPSAAGFWPGNPARVGAPPGASRAPTLSSAEAPLARSLRIARKQILPTWSVCPSNLICTSCWTGNERTARSLTLPTWSASTPNVTPDKPHRFIGASPCFRFARRNRISSDRIPQRAAPLPLIRERMTANSERICRPLVDRSDQDGLSPPIRMAFRRGCRKKRHCGSVGLIWSDDFQQLSSAVFTRQAPQRV
jgi:hypothetical protein